MERTGHSVIAGTATMAEPCSPDPRVFIEQLRRQREKRFTRWRQVNAERSTVGDVGTIKGPRRAYAWQEHAGESDPSIWVRGAPRDGIQPSLRAADAREAFVDAPIRSFEPPRHPDPSWASYANGEPCVDWIAHQSAKTVLTAKTVLKGWLLVGLLVVVALILNTGSSSGVPGDAGIGLGAVVIGIAMLWSCARGMTVPSADLAQISVDDHRAHGDELVV